MSKIIRHRTVNGEVVGSSLYIPKHLALLIPGDADFRAELTDEGILFRYIGKRQPRDDHQPPEWAK